MVVCPFLMPFFLDVFLIFVFWSCILQGTMPIPRFSPIVSTGEPALLTSKQAIDKLSEPITLTTNQVDARVLGGLQGAVVQDQRVSDGDTLSLTVDLDAMVFSLPILDALSFMNKVELWDDRHPIPISTKFTSIKVQGGELRFFDVIPSGRASSIRVKRFNDRCVSDIGPYSFFGFGDDGCKLYVLFGHNHINASDVEAFMKVLRFVVKNSGILNGSIVPDAIEGVNWFTHETRKSVERGTVLNILSKNDLDRLRDALEACDPDAILGASWRQNHPSLEACWLDHVFIYGVHFFRRRCLARSLSCDDARQDIFQTEVKAACMQLIGNSYNLEYVLDAYARMQLHLAYNIDLTCESMTTLLLDSDFVSSLNCSREISDYPFLASKRLGMSVEARKFTRELLIRKGINPNIIYDSMQYAISTLGLAVHTYSPRIRFFWAISPYNGQPVDLNVYSPALDHTCKPPCDATLLDSVLDAGEKVLVNPLPQRVETLARRLECVVNRVHRTVDIHSISNPLRLEFRMPMKQNDQGSDFGDLLDDVVIESCLRFTTLSLPDMLVKLDSDAWRRYVKLWIDSWAKLLIARVTCKIPLSSALLEEWVRGVTALLNFMYDTKTWAPITEFQWTNVARSRAHHEGFVKVPSVVLQRFFALPDQSGATNTSSFYDMFIAPMFGLALSRRLTQYKSALKAIFTPRETGMPILGMSTSTTFGLWDCLLMGLIPMDVFGSDSFGKKFFVHVNDPCATGIAKLQGVCLAGVSYIHKEPGKGKDKDKWMDENIATSLHTSGQRSSYFIVDGEHDLYYDPVFYTDIIVGFIQGTAPKLLAAKYGRDVSNRSHSHSTDTLWSVCQAWADWASDLMDSVDSDRHLLMCDVAVALLMKQYVVLYSKFLGSTSAPSLLDMARLAFAQDMWFVLGGNHPNLHPYWFPIRNRTTLHNRDRVQIVHIERSLGPNDGVVELEGFVSTYDAIRKVYNDDSAGMYYHHAHNKDVIEKFRMLVRAYLLAPPYQHAYVTQVHGDDQVDGQPGGVEGPLE